MDCNVKLLQKYAQIAVQMGVNIQTDQLLIINSPVTCAKFTRLCVEEAYRLGARQVIVHWQDELCTKLDYAYVEADTLAQVPQWILDRKQNEIDRGCAYLHLASSIPSLLENADPNKVKAVSLARQKAMKPFQNYTMANHGQWCIVGVPNVHWAQKVFPDLSEKEAMEKLWEAIFKTVYVEEENNSIAAWEKHNAEITARADKLNQYNFKSLHFKNGIGTNLTVELIRDHIWSGGCEKTTTGVVFNPNMPTEEVFCMPLKKGVQGKVVSTKPLSYQGKLIQQFTLEFKEGKAVCWQASNEEEILKSLLELDEGSAYLGEVALISHDSPISKSGILFYDTLFDENASCHLALGCAYPMNLKGGNQMTEEQLLEAGSNISMTHVDFMFGSNDMEVTGLTEDGNTIVIFKSGNFVF